MKAVYLSRMAEPQWLSYFWECARDEQVDRLELLQKMASVAVSKYAVPKVREDSVLERRNVQRFAQGCFVCKVRARTMVWHHIIQVQHGGSSHLLNQVELCQPCHAKVHPWLVPHVTTAGGWTSAGELTRQCLPWLEQVLTQHATPMEQKR